MAAINGDTVYMKPDKAVKLMRYNYKSNNYTVALPDREEWKNIFARRFEKIKEGVSRIKDSVYYLKRVWFRKEKGYLWEDKEFNRIAKRSATVTCGEKELPCKKRLSFYHTLKKNLEYWIVCKFFKSLVGNLIFFEMSWHDADFSVSFFIHFSLIFSLLQIPFFGFMSCLRTPTNF
jgi:hypothetical protein